jgi:enoyl-CoA hydratase/carnithine racemase
MTYYYFQATEFLLFGRKLTAHEAYERNLVNTVYPDSVFRTETEKRIAEYSQLPSEVHRIDFDVIQMFRVYHCRNVLFVINIVKSCMNAINVK